MSERTAEELLAVIARSLGAESARIVPADAIEEAGPAGAPAAVTLRCDLTEGRRLVVVLAASAAKDASALQRRLEMLVETFSDLLPRERRSNHPRADGARSLHEELVALVLRAGASDAIIIDAHSPVVWGSAAEPEVAVHAPDAARRPVALRQATDEDAEAALHGLAVAHDLKVDPGAMQVVPRAVCVHHRVLPIARSGDKLVLAMVDPLNADAVHDVVLTTGLDVEPVFAGDSMKPFFKNLDGGSESYEAVLAAIDPVTRAEREPRAEAARVAWGHASRARRAIADVRALPELATLRKGGHLRRMVTEGGLNYVARSFAAIYVLLLIYESAFEELVAKRAIAHVLPVIEQLVAALPPLDPTPKTGAVAMRRRRKR